MSVSVVIPTYEMSGHLEALWHSLDRAGIFEVADEVVFVDDGSKDATREVLERLAKGVNGHRLRAVHLERNVGRFLARLEGARQAKGDRVLFIDSRLTLPDDFGAALAKASSTYRSVMGIVDIDVTRNVFCLYWDRSHKRIFRKYYEDTKKPLELNFDNYDEYVKGTTVFLCDRQLFIETSSKFVDLLNDDTFLLKEMVRTVPITIDPSVRVRWVPREDMKSFLARLWERGPSFVEYHVFEHRGAFFWCVVAGGVALVGLVGLTAIFPPAGALAAAGALLATAASTALFAESPRELVRMAPLHVAVVATFGAGVLRGLVVNTRRHLSKAGPRGNAPAPAE